MAKPVTALEHYKIKMDFNSPKTVIALFKEATDSILSINLSWLNLKIYKINTPLFDRRIKRITERDDYNDPSDTYKRFIEDEGFFGHFIPDIYAMVPINVKQPVTIETIVDVKRVLLLLFPSNFHMFQHIEYGIETNSKAPLVEGPNWTIISHNPFHFGPNVPPNDSKLHFEPELQSKVNKFVRVAYERLKRLDYLKFPLKSYESGFGQRDIEISYLNYCMALEALIKTDNGEIGYKLSRLCAVVNGENMQECEAISSFIKTAYNRRSKLVHEGKSNEIEGIYLQLQSLVSRTLIEIIIFNIDNKDTFRRLVEATGYGNKRAFNSKYEKVSLFKPVAKRFAQLIAQNLQPPMKVAQPSKKQKGKK
jgi:hypothetical protein